MQQHNEATSQLPIQLSCADYAFPLLRPDKVFPLLRLLEFERVDLGILANRSHLQPRHLAENLSENAHDYGAAPG